MGAAQCAPYRSRIKKGQTMIKTYCDICSREIRPGGFATSDLIRAKFFGYDEKNRIFGEVLRELDLCAKCYKKIIRETKEMKEIAKTKKEPETAGVMESLKQNMKELQAEEKPAKEESGKKTPKEKDPEETAEKPKKIDKDKIWALRHGKQPWSYDQIAEEMGCSPLTIAEYMRRMKKERGEA
jgi:transcriptional regulator with GAF, ATPase, and Fis domain